MKVVTNASPVYDWACTKTLRELGIGRDGSTFRLVEIDDNYVGQQIARYRSGNKSGIPFEEWPDLKDLLLSK